MGLALWGVKLLMFRIDTTSTGFAWGTGKEDKDAFESVRIKTYGSGFMCNRPLCYMALMPGTPFNPLHDAENALNLLFRTGRREHLSMQPSMQPVIIIQMKKTADIRR